MRAHDEQAIEHYAMRFERGDEGFVWWRHPGAPARRSDAGQGRERGQE